MVSQEKTRFEPSEERTGREEFAGPGKGISFDSKVIDSGGLQETAANRTQKRRRIVRIMAFQL
jgi:hypothetical protein